MSKQKRHYETEITKVGYVTDILANSLDKATQVVRHFDTQSNILIGLSLGIAVFAIGALQSGDFSLPLFILGASASGSALIGLYAIHPPGFMRKQGQKESIFYNKHITSFKLPENYAEEIRKVIGDTDCLIEEYSKEVFNLYKYYYQPKRQLFKASRDILVVGVAFSLLTFLAQLVG